MKIVYYATRFISVLLVMSFIRHERSEFKKTSSVCYVRMDIKS
jgi:hypothetical protein